MGAQLPEILSCQWGLIIVKPKPDSSDGFSVEREVHEYIRQVARLSFFNRRVVDEIVIRLRIHASFILMIDSHTHELHCPRNMPQVSETSRYIASGDIRVLHL